jgi:hypothetical protein
MLTSVADALNIPFPVGPDDEVTYLRLRSERASEAHRAIMRVLEDPRASDLDFAWVAAWLSTALEQYPADTYEQTARTS